MGKTRAAQLALNEGHYNSETSTDEERRHGDRVVCIQVHGDAAIAGQVENSIISQLISIHRDDQTRASYRKHFN